MKIFKGIHIINLSFCNQITDKGLNYLKSVHTIYLNNYKSNNRYIVWTILYIALQYINDNHNSISNCKQIKN